MGRVDNDDRLIPLDEWPGTTAVFSCKPRPASVDPALLELTVTFEPDRLQHVQTAARHLQVVRDQIADLRTVMFVTTALAAEPICVRSSAGEETKVALARFVATILASLAGDGDPPAPLMLSGVVRTGSVTVIGKDLCPFGVSIVFARRGPEQTSAASRSPLKEGADAGVAVSFPNAGEAPTPR